MEKDKDTTITFRTSKKLKKELEEMATGNSRSLSNQIEIILTEAVKNGKEKK